jgi:endonuclease III
MMKVVPKEFTVDVHHWLISHGSYTFIARKLNVARVLLRICVSLKIKSIR